MSIQGLQLTRADETTVPCRIIVRYQDVARDYQIGVQASRPLSGIGSQQVVTLDLPMVLSGDEAKQLAEIRLRNAHTERNGGTFAVPLSFVALEPADVVMLQGRDGSQLKMRITQATFDGAKVDIAAVLEDSIYTSSAMGDSGVFPDQEVGFAGPTDFLLLDIAPLRDADGAEPTLYVAAAGVLDAWRGAMLYRSADSSSWSLVQGITVAACYGTTQTVLGSWTVGQIDITNTVRVRVNGELESFPMDQLLARRDVGAYLVGDEIIQAANATLISDGVYDLSHLIRGQQGTGNTVGTHQAGERVVLLDTRLSQSTIPLAALGQSLHFRADSITADVGSGDVEIIAPVDATIRPLAPAHLYAPSNGNDYAVRWTRCARINNTWRNGGDVPLDETTEVYRVRVLVGGSEKRSTTVTSATIWTYTAAMQATDAVSPGVVFTIEVCQVSDESVIGKPATITLTR
ncbi:phage tail protein [Chitinolyticbacter meiyuanensis]|uniref:phage tail protein n=1 Tax=Chitinolyticbacter meiyuanensis TaxID=682798 RepID=UPI0011E5AE84|nr:phage tail protein [Chitinolyticbacter meiyuanensis]